MEIKATRKEIFWVPDEQAALAPDNLPPSRNTPVFALPRATATCATGWGVNNINACPLSSRAWKSEVKVWAGLVLLGPLSCPCPPHGHPWGWVSVSWSLLRTPLTLPYRNYLFKDPHLQTQSHSEVVGLRTQHRNLGGGTIHPPMPPIVGLSVTCYKCTAVCHIG